MAEIVFRNVTKRYGRTVAVDNASFSVEDNEFYCLFGPPLSGKSTILRLILGLETPDSGEILIGGRSVNAATPAERNVAMVFQNLALFPHMSARENVRFPLVERKVPSDEIDRRLAERRSSQWLRRCRNWGGRSARSSVSSQRRLRWRTAPASGSSVYGVRPWSTW